MTAASTRNGRPPNQVMTSTAAARITADTILSWRLLIRAPSGAGRDDVAFDAPAEPPFPHAELPQRVLELLRREIRPEAGKEDQLAIGRLPEQEVGKPHLAA